MYHSASLLVHMVDDAVTAQGEVRSSEKSQGVVLVMQVLLSVLQERRERKGLDVEEAAVAAAAAAAVQSSKHDPAKGQWDFAQRAQRAAQAEETAAAASGVRSTKKSHHQRHGSASDKEGPTSRLVAEVPPARTAA